MMPIRIGTRRSTLARWQANHVSQLIQASFPQQAVELVLFTTQGDRILDKSLPEIGGKGVFTLELEHALLAGEIDLAVHSLKDLPTEMSAAFTVGAVPKRATPFDALVTRARCSLDELEHGAVIGTSSLRRGAQLKAYRQDLVIKPIRGNVETRIGKAHDASGDYDATVLAVAGLERLGKTDVIDEILPTGVMLLAPGQGAIGIQSRADDAALKPILAALDHAETRVCVMAERAFLNRLEAGCSLPIAAYAFLNGSTLHMRGRVSDLEGKRPITVEGSAPSTQYTQLGVQLAEMALAQGADELLAQVKENIQ